MSARSAAGEKVRPIQLTVELYQRLQTMGLPVTEYEGEIRHRGDRVKVRRPSGTIIADQMVVARTENSDEDIVALLALKIGEVCDASNKYFVGRVFRQDTYMVCIFGYNFEPSLTIEDRVAALEDVVADLMRRSL